MQKKDLHLKNIKKTQKYSSLFLSMCLCASLMPSTAHSASLLDMLADIESMVLQESEALQGNSSSISDFVDPLASMLEQLAEIENIINQEGNTSNNMSPRNTSPSMNNSSNAQSIVDTILQIENYLNQSLNPQSQNSASDTSNPKFNPQNNQIDTNNTTPPHIDNFLNAVADDNRKVYQAMLKEGSVSVDSRSAEGYTPLMVAAVNGNSRAMLEFLALGADPNAINNKGISSLMFASRYGFTECAKLLLNAHADIHQRDEYGSEAFAFAADNTHLETMDLLYNNGADIHYILPDMPSLVYFAMSENEDLALDVMQFLIDRKVNINAQNPKGITPLIAAAGNNNIKILVLLVTNGADINKRDSMGRTALDIAKEEGNQRIIDFLNQDTSKLVFSEDAEEIMM